MWITLWVAGVPMHWDIQPANSERPIAMRKEELVSNRVRIIIMSNIYLVSEFFEFHMGVTTNCNF